MNKKDAEHFKGKLLAEKKELEDDLSTVGKIEVDSADENEVADKLEELEDNNGIASQLESQLNEVKAALERLEKGSYGLCEVCNNPIERERLEANPSSRVSIKHKH
jgi:RNA polymerase-binding transcription factor DksA